MSSSFHMTSPCLALICIKANLYTLWSILWICMFNVWAYICFNNLWQRCIDYMIICLPYGLNTSHCCFFVLSMLFFVLQGVFYLPIPRPLWLIAIQCAFVFVSLLWILVEFSMFWVSPSYELPLMAIPQSSENLPKCNCESWGCSITWAH